LKKNNFEKKEKNGKKWEKVSKKKKREKHCGLLLQSTTLCVGE
jgi:hypothetical protein